MDELARLRFARSAEEVFGPTEAAFLMDHLPYGGIADLATKDDLRVLRAEMGAEMAELRSELRIEMAELRADLTIDMAQLRGEFAEVRGEFAELRGEFAELRGEFGELRGEFGELRGSLDERFRNQLIAMVGIIGAATAVLGTTIVLFG